MRLDKLMQAKPAAQTPLKTRKTWHLMTKRLTAGRLKKAEGRKDDLMLGGVD